MKSTDTPPCPDCGDEFTALPPDLSVPVWFYRCPACGWCYETSKPLTLATAPWTRAVWAEVEATRTERDRLRRILAVERGDAGAAPEGWRHTDRDGWRGNDTLVWCRQDPPGSVAHWSWTTDKERGVAPTALEAMEAADRAAKEPKC